MTKWTNEPAQLVVAYSYIRKTVKSVLMIVGR